jgi:hypothetical protein
LLSSATPIGVSKPRSLRSTSDKQVIDVGIVGGLVEGSDRITRTTESLTKNTPPGMTDAETKVRRLVDDRFRLRLREVFHRDL